MRHFIAIAAIAAIGLIAACSSGDKGPTQRDTIGQTWKYEAGSGDKPKLAYIGSANAVPTMTAADTFAVLLVQPIDNGEKSVTVKLVGAPFQCDLSDCAVTAIADGGRPLRWKGRMTDAKDGIEIMPSQNAYEAIAKAQTLSVNLVTGPKEQTAPFAFNVAGLDLKTSSS